MTHQQRFVISRRRTGFGDCLWSLASAWQYSKRTGRTLVIDWRGSCYLSDPFTNAFSVFFEPLDNISGVPVICDDKINQLCFPGPFFPHWWNRPAIDGVYRSDDQIFHERDELRRLLVTSRDIQANTIVCDACLMWGCDQEAERNIFQSITPRQEIRRRIDDVYHRAFEGHDVIGIHVRHGNGEDTMGHRPYWTDPRVAMEQVCAAVERAKALHHTRPTRLFLCTDSPSVADHLSAVYSELFSIPKRFRANDAGPLHTADLGVEGGFAALVEMYLLAYCHTVIRFPSTSAFSRYASLVVPQVIEFSLDDPSHLILAERSSAEHAPDARSLAGPHERRPAKPAF
ncbi:MULTISPECIES: nodulation protein NodZ [Bradyrhizobium]|uniref:Nodulation protein NodZ n=3 Tax=Bradyrhizobium TaxID=374 RepID=A0AAE5X8S7_9BRAD|nr:MULTISPECIES: nodulation protein NodZ [Bradyrhizobium]MCG2632936.1 nodulation protein NodZ [Bradyrhizobium zhengyangense]MCG2645542.1 nodulation protein NodZ [Bradyrhizobium zhengyangense]MCG2673139.1 nodulation protein NodZ [Bradyrhizobium zhengyangense]MDN4985667.1 nodulation protein NodZ [Bradyrhizobium sp. WYCCWR 13022]MDN5006127.1 nodulation protein NodZ [Bradyrhizobium sp. WYCCWR 12677]